MHGLLQVIGCLQPDFGRMPSNLAESELAAEGYGAFAGTPCHIALEAQQNRRRLFLASGKDADARHHRCAAVSSRLWSSER